MSVQESPLTLLLVTTRSVPAIPRLTKSTSRQYGSESLDISKKIYLNFNSVVPFHELPNLVKRVMLVLASKIAPAFISGTLKKFLVNVS